MEPGDSLPCSQEPAKSSKSEALCNTSQDTGFLRRGTVNPPSDPQAGVTPLVGCPRLLIQYIRSYPPYMEAVSFIHNLRTRHAVVTRDPLKTKQK
jgi:hypothetical protein